VTKKSLFCAVVILSCALLLFPVHSGYSFASESYGSQGKNGCIALGNQGIKDVLTKLNASDAKVLSITESPIKGFCEIAIDNMGRLGIFYLTVDKKFLILGSLIEVANMSDKRQESLKRRERCFQESNRLYRSRLLLLRSASSYHETDYRKKEGHCLLYQVLPLADA
jgi:hypothetical protein